MNRKTGWLAILLMLAVASCGGDGPGLADLRDGPITETPEDEIPVALSSVELLASSPQLQSDGSNTVTLSAFAKNANNQVVAGVPVVFSATSGALVVTEATTNDQGIATAELSTSGDPTNRSIIVTAATGDAGTLTDTVDISVVGSTMQIQGPISLVLEDTGTYTVTLLNSAGAAIAGRPVEIASANGNTLEAATQTTDTNGKITVTLTADQPGNDTLTATALPDADGNPTTTASFNIGISDENFRFTTPTVDEIDLGVNENVTVEWLDDGGAPVTDGEVITFATTRGSVSAPTASTVNGEATITVSSTTAGPATITATTDDGTTAQLAVEFVATDPDQLIMRTDPAVIGPNETSIITAIVEDPAGNRVKNATVTFTLTTDTTGGALSIASAITNSAGEAQTVYTASSATSADDGVVITGRVVGTPLETDATLTVSGRALSMVFGTGNDIEETNEGTTYTKRYTLIVRDSSGAGVPNTTANLSVISTGFYKGFLIPGATHWFRPANAPFCDSEDIDGDGVLDPVPLPSEDVNGDNELTPGGVAIVSPGTVTTDETGVATFQIIYPQDHAMWVTADITATATVAGTESRRTAGFYFPASADDLTISEAPPNPESPWGIADGVLDPIAGTVTFTAAPGTCSNQD